MTTINSIAEDQSDYHAHWNPLAVELRYQFNNRGDALRIPILFFGTELFQMLIGFLFNLADHGIDLGNCHYFRAVKVQFLVPDQSCSEDNKKVEASLGPIWTI